MSERRACAGLGQHRSTPALPFPPLHPWPPLRNTAAGFLTDLVPTRTVSCCGCVAEWDGEAGIACTPGDVVGCSFAITTRTENKHRGTVAYAAHNSEETANEAAPKEGEASCSAHNQAKPEAGRPAVTATGYAAGELVSHPMFGPGTVTAVDTDKLTIKFAIRSNRLSTTM